jgi:hypothetical protein
MVLSAPLVALGAFLIVYSLRRQNKAEAPLAGEAGHE